MNTKIKPKAFRVRRGAAVHLDSLPTAIDPFYSSKENCRAILDSRDSPWRVVPPDDKENARRIVAEIVVRALERLKMSYPETNEKRRPELLSFRKVLAR